ncbi:MAG: MFS transporter [Acidimicrobiia bacterium]
MTEVDYTRKWYVMAAVGLSILLATIDISIVNVALPTLETELDSTFPVIQWVVLAYALTLATLTLGVGRLGDIVGKKAIFASGFAVFTVASVLCGLSPSVAFLIGCRVVQAIGATMVLALGIGIVTEAFPDHERGRALGVIGTMVSIGIVIGPTLGGFLIEQLSWRWIFLVNLPVGVLGTIAAVLWVPAIKPPGGQRFDWLGGGLMFVSLLTMSLGLSIGQRRGFGDGLVIALLITAAASLVVFLMVEQRVPEPMVDLQLFRQRIMRINLGTGFTTFVAIAGVLILMPFYLINVKGFDSQQAGILLASTAILIGVVAPLSGWVSDRIGIRPVTVVGLAVLTVGYLAASNLDGNTSAVGYVLLVTPIGVGMGIFQSPNNSGVMGAAPRERLGITSGMLTLTRIVGQIVGVAVLGSLWAVMVTSRAGGFDGPATSAPAEAQVAGLQVILAAMAAVMAIGVAVTGWDLLRTWRKRVAAPPESLPEETSA